MTNFPHNVEWVRNTKTGSIGQVVARYVDFKGRAIIQVKPLSYLNKPAYWRASNTEAYHG